jgi:hypothetical protein
VRQQHSALQYMAVCVLRASSEQQCLSSPDLLCSAQHMQEVLRQPFSFLTLTQTPGLPSLYAALTHALLTPPPSPPPSLPAG